MFSLLCIPFHFIRIPEHSLGAQDWARDKRNVVCSMSYNEPGALLDET